MIVAGENRADLEVRAGGLLRDWPWTLPVPDSLLGAGLVSLEHAVGLPALTACLYRLAEGIGQMPQIVYRGGARREQRERATDSDQWRLLHKRPNEDTTPSVFRGDIAMSVAGTGNAYIRKFKSTVGRVMDLVPLDATTVVPRRMGGRVVFEDSSEGQTVTRTSREIIHVRGIALAGAVEGMSRITATRLALANALRRIQFEDRFYKNDARPGIALTMPMGVDQEQAERWLDVWRVKHEGLDRAHRPAAVPFGTDITPIPVSLEDAQFVESQRFSVQQTAGLFGIPSAMVAPRDDGPGLTESDRVQFVTFALGPLFVGIDEAFNADRDLFPDDDPEELFVESLADALLRPDTASRYSAYKAARQAGWLTANEIRALENYPPRDEGDELQSTPVGGAPNADSSSASMVMEQLELLLDGNGHDESDLERARALIAEHSQEGER